MTSVQTRTLGGVVFSEIALGTWGLAAQSYGPVPEVQFRETVKEALASGVTTFDMAPSWGDGLAERVVGEVIQSARDRVQYVTRAGGDGRWDAPSLVRSAEASLDRLGSASIDLLLLHNPGVDVLSAQTFRAAADTLKSSGKVRLLGASVGTAEEARLALQAHVDAICLPYNLLWSSAVHDVVGEIEAAGAGLFVRSPLAYGLLSGTWSAGRRFPRGDHRADRWRDTALAIRVKQAASLRFLIRGEIRSLADAALRFVLSNRLVTSAIVGARSPLQIRQASEAVRAGAPYLDDEALMQLSQTLAALGVDV